MSGFISPRFVTLDHFVTGFATGVGGSEERRCQAWAIEEEFSFPVCPVWFSTCVAVSNIPSVCVHSIKLISSLKSGDGWYLMQALILTLHLLLPMDEHGIISFLQRPGSA